MARTRASKPKAADVETKATSSSNSTRIAIGPEVDEPPKILILPSNTTPDARIYTLPDPANSKPCRYYVCPERGMFEFKKIAAPKTAPKSWLIGSPEPRSASAAVEQTGVNNRSCQAQVVSAAELFLATPIDPLFLVLPVLLGPRSASDSEQPKKMFLTSEDYFEKLPSEFSHMVEMSRLPKITALFESRMRAICDVKEFGDEPMFRLNEDKLANLLLTKATAMSQDGFPASMEEKLVRKPLEAPIVVQTKPSQQEIDSGISTPQPDTTDTQSTKDSAISITTQSSFTEDRDDTEGLVSAMVASPQIVLLQRLRVALGFICSSYTPAAHRQSLLQKAQAQHQGAGFALLDDYLSQLSKIRAEIVAARSIGNDHSRKHGRDEEEDEMRAEKKRKLEEEKKKKLNESRALKDLKKVNTKGMKKMSDFFGKK